MNPREINLSERCWLPGSSSKKTVEGLKAAVSSDNAVVTYTLLNILERGGNAIDAGIAGCLLQGVLEPYMTNHAGTVTALYYDAESKAVYQLDSTSTYPSGLPLHRPMPPRSASAGWASTPMASSIPGFAPGIKALHERFGSLSWPELTEEAIWWADNGNHVSEYEREATMDMHALFTYYPETRAYFKPNGRLVQIGERFPKPGLGDTLRGIANEGPDYMITGAWAEAYVKKANEMGWKITLDHMRENPPRWVEPYRFKVKEYELCCLALPQQQGQQQALILGILEQLKIDQYEPYSAEHLYYMAHALRMGNFHTGYMQDTVIANPDYDLFRDKNYHAYLARLIESNKPKVDLSEHMKLSIKPSPRGSLPSAAFSSDERPKASCGSCEISIVDQNGNWLQIMNTIQGSGIPGVVVGGVPMGGSSAGTNGFEGMQVKLVPGARTRLIMGHTIIMKDQTPILMTGSPGNPSFSQAQMLTNLLFYKMDPFTAGFMPRMYGFMGDTTILIEDRIQPEVIADLRKLGSDLLVTEPWDSHTGSFQTCFRNELGILGTTVDPRRCGVADGIKL